MDYEKKYKSLVEAVKTLKEANPSDEGIQNWVNDNVPELAENEDEKIRKELLDFCENRAENYPNNPKYRNISSWIAWLKKQGEQKSYDIRTTGYWNVQEVEQKPATWSEEDEVKISRIVACLENLNVADNDILLKDVAWLKSLRPQNHWKPSEEQIEALNAINVTGCISYSGQGQKLINLYNDLKNLK